MENENNTQFNEIQEQIKNMNVSELSEFISSAEQVLQIRNYQQKG